jgi:hypothetical protein
VDGVRVRHHPNWSLISRRASCEFIPDASGLTPRRMRSHRSTSGGDSSPPFRPSAPSRCGSASRASPAPGLRCRLLTSAGRSGRIPPPSVLSEDTPQISRGQRSYRPCISARCIKHSPLWMEDFTVACPLVPAVPHLISGLCPSPRTFVPRVLQTPPHGDALALPWSFRSTHTWTGDFHPRA